MPDPKDVVLRLFPRASDRKLALDALIEGIQIAHAENSLTWCATLTDGYIRLNVGRAEIFALYETSMHFVCERSRLPSKYRPRDRTDAYASLPGSSYVDISIDEARDILPLIRQAWHDCIRTAAHSAKAAVFRRYHSTELWAFLRAHDPAMPVPGWAEDGAADSVDGRAIKDLRDNFLSRHPDFGGDFSEPSSYRSHEREYKLEICGLCRARLDPLRGLDARDPDRVVRAALSVLTSKLTATGAAQNLVGWRYFDFLRHLTKGEKERFAGAFLHLLFAEGPSPGRLEHFSKEMWRPMQRTMGGNPYAQMRMFPTFFLMMMNPRGDFAMRTDLLDAAGKRLLGRSMLRREPVSAAEYTDVLQMADGVMRQLEQWGWQPKDMIDVHSFLWIATRNYEEAED